MPTIADIQAVDCIGFGRFGERQCKAMVDMIKRTGKLNSEPPACSGRGVLIMGGGKYLSWAWCVAKRIRDLGCQLPIQVWFLGPSEMPRWAVPFFTSLDVETVDTLDYLKIHPHRTLQQYVGEKKWTLAGWVAKNFAIEHSPWEQVLYLDSDAFPSINPEKMFEDSHVKETGSLFFSDVCSHRKSNWPFVYCGLEIPRKEWEAGQKIVHKTKAWMGLRWANWMLEHLDTWGVNLHGDKECDHLGFKVSGVPYLFSEDAVWSGWGISQRWKNVEWVQHAMGFKRGEHAAPSTEVQQLFWDWEALKRKR